jgi:hypothetical protein
MIEELKKLLLREYTESVGAGAQSWDDFIRSEVRRLVPSATAVVMRNNPKAEIISVEQFEQAEQDFDHRLRLFYAG